MVLPPWLRLSRERIRAYRCERSAPTRMRFAPTWASNGSTPERNQDESACESHGSSVRVAIFLATLRGFGAATRACAVQVRMGHGTLREHHTNSPRGAALQRDMAARS